MPFFISDIINTTIQLIPNIIRCFFILSILNLCLYTWEKSSNKIEHTSNSESPIIKRSSIFYILIFSYFTLKYFAFGVTPGTSFLIYWFIASVAWLHNVSPWLMQKKFVLSKNPTIPQIMLIYLPIFIFLFVALAKDDVDKILLAKPDTIIELKISENKPPLIYNFNITGKLIRSYERFAVIIEEKNKNILFIPWSNILEIRDLKIHKIYRGIVCEKFQQCVDPERDSPVFIIKF